MFHERFLKRKRSGWLPRWSEGSRTPSATSTRSTMGSTASTTYVHQNEHLKHVSLTIFEKKMIWMSSKGIWGLSESDTLAWPTAPPKIFTALPYFKAIQSNRKMCFFGGLYLMHINSLPPQVKCENRWDGKEFTRESKKILAPRSPWEPSRSFSIQKSFMKHISNVHFYEYKWYLLYSPWLSLSRSLRVS